MIIKGLEDENFTNYKVPSMFIAFPKCSFKCDKECGFSVCQNSELARSWDLTIACTQVADRYMANNITKAIVCGGLEPFDSYPDLFKLVRKIRNKTQDPIVIYTGYTEEEIAPGIEELKQYPNIIVKFGRFVPNQKPHFDEVLGIELASDNQYAKQIS